MTTRLSRLSRSVAGRVVLVTGAASGMGRATAHLFADEGARVAVTDVEAGGVRAVVEEIEASGGAAAGFPLDVADREAVARTVAVVAERLGPVDVLVNNAGVSSFAPIDHEGHPAAWDRALAVNLTGQANLVRACLPHLLREGAGRIVNVASTEAHGATAFGSPYTASKHGVVGLTRSLAVELGPRIRTGMTAPIPEEAKQKFARRRVPLRRYGEPEEVAHVILSLALPAASYVNGAVVVVDGGMLSQNT
jgi:3-oxoacyl-[acyl-carrier protein] reductase